MLCMPIRSCDAGKGFHHQGTKERQKDRCLTEGNEGNEGLDRRRRELYWPLFNFGLCFGFSWCLGALVVNRLSSCTGPLIANRQVSIAGPFARPSRCQPDIYW
jgi:hypothetical protein